MKSNNILTKIAIAGLVVGGLMIFYAYVYAAWSEHTGRTIGANIGAGVVGIFGIQIAGAAALLLLISLAYSRLKIR